uniref:IST1 homolog n=1 Tax=Eptatretus burgeri TaxID=7764 RepID=A0A8C4QEQ1_EPTBU
MFHGGYKGDRLRVNLRLVVNRLKLLEKKKTELAQKARKDIADYLAGGKHERARIRVEHIIREDYLVEAMEILELFCDLLLARFGLIQSMKELDPGLEESISSLIWAAPRLQSEVLELKVVSDQLCSKYSKEYGKLCRSNQNGTVNERLIAKLSVEAPPKILVERYLIEIAKNYNVPFEPDSFVMSEIPPVPEADLIGIYDSNKWGGGGVEAVEAAVEAVEAAVEAVEAVLHPFNPRLIQCQLCQLFHLCHLYICQCHLACILAKKWGHPLHTHLHCHRT